MRNFLFLRTVYFGRFSEKITKQLEKLHLLNDVARSGTTTKKFLESGVARFSALCNLLCEHKAFVKVAILQWLTLSTPQGLVCSLGCWFKTQPL